MEKKKKRKKECCDKHLIRQNTELFEFHEADINFVCKILKCVTQTQTSLPHLCGNTKLSIGLLNKKYYCEAIDLLQKGYCIHCIWSAAFLKDADFCPKLSL